jgi:hypothetical protein
MPHAPVITSVRSDTGYCPAQQPARRIKNSTLLPNEWIKYNTYCYTPSVHLFAPLCIRRLNLYLPGVILNFATTYLRMMAVTLYAAKESGMGDKRDSLVNNEHRCKYNNELA